MRKHSRFYTDKQGRVRYMGGNGQKQSTAQIRTVETAPMRTKGNFVTIKDKVVFIGGPSSGAGSSSGSSLLSKLSTNPMTVIDGETYKKGDYPSVKVSVDEAGDAILKENIIREGKPSTAQSEVVAYEIAQELGYNNLIPPTAIRGNASIQAWVDNSVPSNKYTKALVKKYGPVDEESIKQILIFDALTNNADRHPGNMLIAQVGGKSRAVAIDNSLAFGANNILAKGARSTVRLALLYDGYTLEDVRISKPRLTSTDVEPIRKLLNTPTFWTSMTARIGQQPTAWMRERAEYMVTPDFLEAEW